MFRVLLPWWFFSVSSDANTFPLVLSLKPGTHVLKALSSSCAEHPVEHLAVLSLEAMLYGYLSIKVGNISASVSTMTSTLYSMNTSSKLITYQTFSISSPLAATEVATKTGRFPQWKSPRVCSLSLCSRPPWIRMVAILFLTKKSYNKIYFLLSFNKNCSFFITYVLQNFYKFFSFSVLASWENGLLNISTCSAHLPNSHKQTV